MLQDPCSLIGQAVEGWRAGQQKAPLPPPDRTAGCREHQQAPPPVCLQGRGYTETTAIISETSAGVVMVTGRRSAAVGGAPSEVKAAFLLVEAFHLQLLSLLAEAELGAGSQFEVGGSLVGRV